jgi:membrane protein DedA with SNARE-associated domain
MLDSITNYIASLSPGWLYFALFLSSYIENIFPPVPGDTVTVFGAYVVGRTREHFLGVFISTTLGSIAGFMTIYALGKLIRPDYFITKNFRFFPAKTFLKAGSWFARYGYWVILANRFLSGIRFMISVVAGVYRLPWLKVMILAGISCALWNLILIWVGYLLGANWPAIQKLLEQYSRVLITVVILTGAIWLLRRRRSPKVEVEKS